MIKELIFAALLTGASFWIGAYTAWHHPPVEEPRKEIDDPDPCFMHAHMVYSTCIEENLE